MTKECANAECPSSPLASEFGLRGYFVIRHFELRLRILDTTQIHFKAAVAQLLSGTG
jgi:hypothetical protein